MRCSMSGCTNQSHINKNVYYFKFPMCLETQNMWKSICKIKTFGVNARVCSLHFKTCDIVQTGEQIGLVKTALPLCYEPNVEAANLLKLPTSPNLFKLPTSKTGNVSQNLERTIVTTPGNPVSQYRFVFQLPEPNAIPYIKSVAGSMSTQTNTRLCGSVEISECSDEYRLNCFHCCETFLLEKWFQFVDHLKQQHFKKVPIFKIPKFPNCDHDYTTVRTGISKVLKSSETIKNLTRTCVKKFPTRYSFVHGTNRNLREGQRIEPTSLRVKSCKRKSTSEVESEEYTESTPSIACIKQKVKQNQPGANLAPAPTVDAAKPLVQFPPAKRKVIVKNKDEYIAKTVVQQTLRNIREFEARYKSVKTKPPRDIYLGKSRRVISSGVYIIKDIGNNTLTQKQTSTKATPLTRCLKRANTETVESLPEPNQTQNHNHSELVFQFTPRDIIIDFLDSIKDYPILWEFHKEPNNEDYAKAIQNLCTQINEKWSLNLSALQMRRSINRVLTFYRFMLPCKKVQMFTEYFEKCSKFLPTVVKEIPRKRCIYCDLCFVTDSDIRKHLADVHDYLKWQYKCGYCSERFMENDEYELHTNLPHYLQVYKCNKCNAQFNRRQSLNNHSSKCHEAQPVSEVPVTTTTSEVAKPRILFKCHLCEKKYTQRFALTVHLKRHMKQYDFVCEVCGKAFVKRSSLFSHMETHTGEKVTCNICNLKLRKCSLSRHLRLVHVACEGTIESTFRAKNHHYKKFSDNYSPPKRTKRTTRTTYKRSKETGPRKYDCKKCNIHFDRLKLLKDHNNIIHCNRKIWHCKICNVAFRFRNNIRVHYIKTHKLNSLQIMKIFYFNEDIDKILNLKDEETNETQILSENQENTNEEQLNDVTNLSTSIQDEIMKAIESIDKEKLKIDDDGSMNDFFSELLKH